MKKKDQYTITLIKAQLLHKTIDRLFFLSRATADLMHEFLDDVITDGHLLDRTKKTEWREDPNGELLESLGQ